MSGGATDAKLVAHLQALGYPLLAARRAAREATGEDVIYIREWVVDQVDTTRDDLTALNITPALLQSARRYREVEAALQVCR